METSRPRVFAVGDAASYPGKLRLILSGFHEAAVAVRYALPYVRPGERVRHVFSTAMPVFRKVGGSQESPGS